MLTTNEIKQFLTQEEINTLNKLKSKGNVIVDFNGELGLYYIDNTETSKDGIILKGNYVYSADRGIVNYIPFIYINNRRAKYGST